MRSLRVAAMIAMLATNVSAFAAAPTKINLQGVLRETADGPIFLQIAAGDLDGDGLPDESFIKLICAGSEIEQAFHAVQSPRDAASGQASGKRQHKPITFTKKWEAASQQLREIRSTYDVKPLKGGRVATQEGWTPITVSGGQGLCAEAARITRTSSNIQNN